MSLDEKPVALPRLYGAPAYAGPRVATAPTPRPFDLDQLPLEVYQTDEDVRFAEHLRARGYAAGGNQGDQRGPTGGSSSGGLRPRLFTLRAIAGRLLGGH